MDWKYTNEPDGKTCLAMNEGRCSWHRGKAIGHNGSKAFLKSQLSNAQISLFWVVHGIQPPISNSPYTGFQFFFIHKDWFGQNYWSLAILFFQKLANLKNGDFRIGLGFPELHFEFYAPKYLTSYFQTFQKTVAEIVKDIILFML